MRPDAPTDGVTELQSAEELARMAAERMAFAANAPPALIAYLDTSVRYVWVDDTYSRWFGRRREEILGRHASDVLDPGAWAAVQPYVERTLAGEEVAFDNRTIFEGGVTRDVRASYVPHRDDGGRICGFVALVNDTTETKAVERALRRSETSGCRGWTATRSPRGCAPRATPARRWWRSVGTGERMIYGLPRSRLRPRPGQADRLRAGAADPPRGLPPPLVGLQKRRQTGRARMTTSLRDTRGVP